MIVLKSGIRLSESSVFFFLRFLPNHCKIHGDFFGVRPEVRFERSEICGVKLPPNGDLMGDGDKRGVDPVCREEPAADCDVSPSEDCCRCLSTRLARRCAAGDMSLSLSDIEGVCDPEEGVLDGVSEGVVAD